MTRAPGARAAETRPVAAVVTHHNLEGLQNLLPSVRLQARDLGFEVIVVDNASTGETKKWLSTVRDDVTILSLSSNEGPAAAYNAIMTERPRAIAYALLQDDLMLRGGELEALLATLRSNGRIGLVSGLPCSEDGTPLACSFSRRPFGEVFPRLWNRWMGDLSERREGEAEWVDVIGFSAPLVRGRAAREVGEFDVRLWPAGFEDLDFCARLRFRGWGVVLHRGIPIRQKVSVTMEKVFGPRYPILRRSSGVMYALMNYPSPVAAGRLATAFCRAVAGRSRVERLGDAHGVLRCARNWNYIWSARADRRRLRLSARGRGT